MDAGWAALTPAQAAVARPYLARHAARRHHVVIYLSGAHAYGFPSPDSDLDLKCVHLAPTRTLVGLHPAHDDNAEIVVEQGVELDYTSNELGPALLGCIKGNGNYLERVLGELVLGGDADLLEQVRAIVRPLLSTKVARHYAGFAMSQVRAFDEAPTAKRALYVLRTAATGRHLLASGALETDLRRLPHLQPAGTDELLAAKQRGEREPLSAAAAAAWRARLLDAVAAIDAAAASSPLPPEAPAAAIADAEAWLVERRRVAWT